MKRLRRGPLLVALAMIGISCSGSDDATPQTTTSATTTTVPFARVEDGQLKLGVLLPTNDALLGEPLLDAVNDAVAAVNDDGGVLGQPVEMVVADEGATAAQGAAAVETLLDGGVDAVVGPASSLVALNVLADLVDAGIVTCSPTANALRLDGFPDDDLFFRTIPSDSVEARAIAEQAEATGAASAVIAHVDDAYGREFADATATAIGDRTIDLLESISYLGRDDDLSEEAQAIIDSEASVVIVLGAGEDAARLLVALEQLDEGRIRHVLVNGAIRSPASQPLLASLNSEFRGKITGVAPQAVANPDDEPWVPEGSYATQTFDCVNLVALATLLADSTLGLDIAAQIPQASANGSVCQTFSVCRAIHEEDLNFNYNGPTGVSELGRSGEPVTARFVRFGFGESGRDVWRGSETYPN